MAGQATLADMTSPDTDDRRSMRERMEAGDLYIADDPEIIADLARAQSLTAQFNTMALSPQREREDVLRQLLGSLGEDCEIRSPFSVDYGHNITIGDRVFVNFGLVALDVAAITIGDDSQIGPNVQLLTPTHPVEPELRLQKWEAARPIAIGENVWIGGGVIVLPGVTIGDNTVVGAGSVVVQSLPENVIAVGNPARVIRSV